MTNTPNSRAKSFDSEEEIINLVKFKQEVTDAIDNCINLIKNNDTGNSEAKRLITQVMTYYERMKTIYSSHYESDDETDLGCVSEESDDSNSMEDYTKLMKDRIFISPNSTTSKNLMQEEAAIRRRLLGLDNEFDVLDDNVEHMGLLDDQSTDPPIYDDTNSNQENFELETDEDYVSHNTKKIFKTLPPDTEIIINENTEDYDEPDIQL